MDHFPAQDLIVGTVFLLCVATTVAGALLAVITTRIVRAVCGLAICCVGIAGLYYFLHSPFLALMEILVYIGAVCVTIIFGIMLAEPDLTYESKRDTTVLWGIVALLAGAAICWGLSRLGLQGPWPAPPAQVSDGSTKAIGVSLLSTYSMAFEAISLVLFVAILGALVIARAGRTKA
ncbi:MAG: NADH-quinone oxidoreductase subunit J [Verrucomicrobia bacterium]|nr:NADH-quinone oxidoreductase subunit J [Verrucomicrobiota bacterium]